MAEGYIRVDPDSSGKKVDTSELTRSDGTDQTDNTVVERERVVIGDPFSADTTRLARVYDYKLQVGDQAIVDALTAVLREIRQLRFDLLNQLH